MTAPLTRDEAERRIDGSAEDFFAEIAARQQRLTAAMPTEHDALRVMSEALARLSNFGWSDACYCPKDGSTFDVIEAGSTGIHKAHYQGEWPKGCWWIHDNRGDMWPSRPILWRPHQTATLAKQENPDA